MNDYQVSVLQPVCPDCGADVSALVRAVAIDWRDEREERLGVNADAVQQHRAVSHRVLPKVGDVVVYYAAWRGLIIDPVMLCGTMFGLRAPDVDGVELQLQRHRLFETSFPIALAPSPCAHDSTPVGGSYKGARRRTPADRDAKRRGGYTPALSVRAALLGIDWTLSEHELAQAIPPIYTEWLGREALSHLLAVAS